MLYRNFNFKVNSLTHKATTLHRPRGRCAGKLPKSFVSFFSEGLMTSQVIIRI
jgi:hypothetical protein